MSYKRLASIRIKLRESCLRYQFEVSCKHLVSNRIELGEFKVSYVCLVSIRIDLGEFKVSYICLVQFEAIWVTYDNGVNSK